MPPDVFFYGFIGIIIALATCIVLSIVYRMVLVREAKFNYQTEMLSGIDKTFVVAPNKLHSNTCQMQKIAFVSGNELEKKDCLAFSKGNFKL